MLARWTPPSPDHRLFLGVRFAEPGEVVDVPDGVVHPWLLPVGPVPIPVTEPPATPAEVPEPIEPPVKRSRRKGQN